MSSRLITSNLVPTAERTEFVGRLFAVRFLWVESFVFDTANSLSEDYKGGYWDYWCLSNAGFYMAPTPEVLLRVACANGFQSSVSADAFGITCCLYAYSFLSFSPDEEFAALCANHYHRLRPYALQHAEAASIFAAID